MNVVLARSSSAIWIWLYPEKISMKMSCCPDEQYTNYILDNRNQYFRHALFMIYIVDNICHLPLDFLTKMTLTSHLRH